MDNEDIINFTKKFMDETREYSNFRYGGNLGRIIQGKLQKDSVEKLTESIDKLSKIIELYLIKHNG